MAINLTILKKAFEQFQTMYYFYKSNQAEGLVEDAVEESIVQRFEYCEELFWKTLRKFIQEYHGINIIASPKEVYRQAGKLEILNTEMWFEFLKARNDTSHIYSEKNLEYVLSIMDDFEEYGRKLLSYLEENNED